MLIALADEMCISLMICDDLEAELIIHLAEGV